MQRAPVTVEEQLLQKAIKEECPWENLPKRIQLNLSSKEEWHRRIIESCIKKRLQWNNCFARKVCRESEYYEDMMHYLRKNLALFPYHLAEYVCRVMRVSPFRYYCDMIFEVMKNEQPYDSIPNFSAADALRLTGIGRNEFIDIMNRCRSKKIMWKLNKSIAKELLPTQPVDFPIEPWWGVCFVNFTLEEFKKLSEEEMATIDKVCKEEANSFILFDPNVVKGLYKRGLVYFDVPVYPDDRFKVSRLEGFVSNREQTYEDPIEELLYAVFVVSNENASVAELATTLQADLAQLQAAASFVCRLGWATKVIDPASILQDTSAPGSRRSIVSDELGQGFENMLINNDSSRQADASSSAYTRAAFIVDANITSYLMMGSVSPGLKSHAVTLYEAGKLGHASIADLCRDLGTLEGAKFEGELQEFANHAFSLRCVLECLQSGGTPSIEKEDKDFSKMDTATSCTDESSSMEAEISLAGKSEHSVITEPRMGGDSLDNAAEASTSSEAVHGSAFSGTQASMSNGKHQNVEQLIAEDSLGATIRGKRKYRVEILRCESLASLAPETLDRLFLRDYDIVVSMVPLPHSSVLPGPTGPVHFGPPSYSFMTPWMKLVLYSYAASGPLSVILMKGQCMRFLPAPLAGCAKALIWSWDDTTVGGLGGKHDGNLVNGSILLHCLNSLLKHSAVLVQPLSRFDLDKSGKLITVDIPLPLKNSDGSIDPVGEDLGISEKESSELNSLLSDLANKIELHTFGYIRLLRLFKGTDSEQSLPTKENYEWVPLSVEFGMPLFSPKLCNNICKRVLSSQLLQSGLFGEHHNAMQSLRKKLRDICAVYHATGPAAKLLYQKDQAKESSQLHINYASGTWKPLAEPSSLISGATSENQRLKLVSRQCCGSEILCFDGSILRSFAAPPGYEDVAKLDEEPQQVDPKSEADENDSKEVTLPGVNLIFDGSKLHPFDIGVCLQARQPIFLIAEAAAISSTK
ncbi:hypothetical protein PIB30_046331 [Stylosanthes scabra]|uniref:Protein FAM91A1 n=1 Tax=Stylosanthes scabra TaxID=79078 RepID=A0ABU6VHV3_9FABA|nr:hypothetical protein [Stylosanthes scabra]